MALKTDFYVEVQGKQTDYNSIVKTVKEKWVADGNLVKDMERLELYFKPEESVCYYVVNEISKGSVNV